jgi:hypothetical protein
MHPAIGATACDPSRGAGRFASAGLRGRAASGRKSGAPKPQHATPGGTACFPFLWVLSFGNAKESTPPPRGKRQAHTPRSGTQNKKVGRHTVTACGQPCRARSMSWLDALNPPHPTPSPHTTINQARTPPLTPRARHHYAAAPRKADIRRIQPAARHLPCASGSDRHTGGNPAG